MKSIIIFNLFLMLSLNVYSHKNKNIERRYGNVRVLFTTSFYYEEINKALIIGEYAEMLSKKLNYTKQITLWFKHNSSNSESIKYLVSYDDLGDKTKKGEVFIKLVGGKYNIEEVLALLEYSIINNHNIHNWGDKISSKNISNESALVKEITQRKVYRPNTVEELKVSIDNFGYYYSEGNFHIYRKGINKEETIVLTTESLFQFSQWR